MECYLAIKKESLLLATAWMDLVNIMLNERSQSQKNKYHMISLICGIKAQDELRSKIQADSQIESSLKAVR